VWKNAPPSLRAVVEAGRAHGEKIFLVHEDERVSYEAFHRAVSALAREFRAQGVVKGDRVAIDASAGTLLWQSHDPIDGDDSGSFTASPLALGDQILFVAQSGHEIDHHAATGRAQAERAIPGRVSATPVLWAGAIYYASEEGRVFGPPRAPGDSGACFSAAAGIKASPLIAADRMILADEEGVVWCLTRRAESSTTSPVRKEN